LISRLFNHATEGSARSRTRNDSRTGFFRPEPIAILVVDAGSDVNQGGFPMIFAGPFVRRLSMVTAYVAFAFVGAIVLGVF
jgi:hypothetical protein